MNSRFYFLIFACTSMLIKCNSVETDEKSLSVKGKILSEQELKGEALFKVHCITCHTLRYIDMQPAFTRKTWEKITDKMIKSFGASIPDSSAVLIVDYLMSVKGKNE